MKKQKKNNNSKLEEIKTLRILRITALIELGRAIFELIKDLIE